MSSVSSFPSLKKKHTSRSTFQWLLPNTANAIWKAILRNLNYVQCSNKGPMEKTCFMAPVEYNPIGKDIMAPMGYILMVHSPTEKDMVLRKIIFRRDDFHGKR